MRLMDFGRDLQLAAELALLAIDPDLLGLRHQPALDHRRNQLGFLVADGEIFGQALDVHLRLVQFLFALVEARLQDRELVGEVFASRHQQLLLVVADLRGEFLDGLQGS